MGMSTHIYGYFKRTVRFEEMMEVAKACSKAGIEVPQEVDDFFGGELPFMEEEYPDLGLAAELGDYATKVDDDMREIFIIHQIGRAHV